MARVLVVDDEPDVRLVARLVLSSAGYDVLEAASGEEALAAIFDDPRPDAVLLDIRMNGIDGWETMRRLRNNLSGHATPVVIFTADATARTAAPQPWNDYEHFLLKPFEPDGLLEAVEQAIESGD